LTDTVYNTYALTDYNLDEQINKRKRETPEILV